MTPPPIPGTERSDPVQLVALVALVAAHGMIRLAERYLPEFVSALGYGPIVVGSLVTLGLGVAAAASERSSGVTADGSATSLETTAVAVLSTTLAAIGLFAWAGAPTLDALLGTPLSALGWLTVGVVLIQAWHVAGPARDLWPIDTRVTTARSSPDIGEPDDAADGPPRRATVPDRRTRIVVGALGVAAAAVVATAVVANVNATSAGFALLSAVGAAVVLVGAAAIGTDGTRSRLLGGRPRETGRANGAATGDGPSLAVVRRAVSGVPDRRRWAVVGDALVRVAIAGISPFLILLVVDYRPIGLSVGGLSLAPVAVFGLFVLAEAVGAVVGAVAFPALASRVDRRALLGVGLAVVSLLPMALVAAPASAGVVAVLFGLLGCRTAIEPLRPTVGASARASPVPGPRLPDEIRTAVRIAVVPAPLLGGILYAIDPLVAFTVATTVGLLGVRELARAFTRDP